MTLRIPPYRAPHRAPLVLLAAGLGTRYGGAKPLAPVGRGGRPLLLVALDQAAAAGFERAVVVVSEATESLIEAALRDAPIPCSYARQVVPAGRTKPLGTVDAVCEGVTGIDGDVVVANGDDLYGVPALRAALVWVEGGSAADGAAIAYRLGPTLRGTTGGVSRAVITVDDDGTLAGIRECRGVHVDGDRIVSEAGDVLGGDTLVSLNLWCFRGTGLAALHAATASARATLPAADEIGLPQTVQQLIEAGALRIDVRTTDSPWHGVTWASDVARVREELERSDG